MRVVISLAGNKRKFPRAPLDAPVELSFGGKKVAASVKEISEGGCCLVCSEQLQGVLGASFEIPGCGAQKVAFEVRWVTRPGQSRRATGGFACGCRFSDVDSGARQSIALYVGKMRDKFTQLQLALAMGKPRFQFAPLLHDVGLTHLVDREKLKHHVAEVIAQLKPNNVR